MKETNQHELLDRFNDVNTKTNHGHRVFCTSLNMTVRKHVSEIGIHWIGDTPLNKDFGLLVYTPV